MTPSGAAQRRVVRHHRLQQIIRHEKIEAVIKPFKLDEAIRWEKSAWKIPPQVKGFCR